MPVTKENDQKNVILKYLNLLENLNKESANQFLSLDEKMQTNVVGMALEKCGNAKIERLFKKIAEIKGLHNVSKANEELLLLSSSPRRHFIIKEIFGLNFSSQNADTMEHKPDFFTRPETVTTVIALMKLLSIFDNREINGKYVIASDTLCQLEDGTILGKPEGETDKECLKDAEFILKSILPGSIQTVSSSVILFDVENHELHIRSASTKIKFKPENEIDEKILAYYLNLSRNRIDGRGPIGKAGGYGIQEPEILYLTEYINGDPFTVIALPIYETIHLLECCGICIEKKAVDKDILLDAIWGKETCLSMNVYPPLKDKFASDFSQLAKKKIINF